mmetsp:Transcript_17689/g.57913  ORF Transcript_17689/g.57913 Transcript_17689/m.57913 type:complete len:248 (+) Transcript_17689:39-782(+)|eukprot:scaffold5702_cov89-Isochrysis_galbana.AAC.1
MVRPIRRGRRATPACSAPARRPAVPPRRAGPCGDRRLATGPPPRLARSVQVPAAAAAGVQRAPFGPIRHPARLAPTDGLRGAVAHRAARRGHLPCHAARAARSPVGLAPLGSPGRSLVWGSGAVPCPGAAARAAVAAVHAPVRPRPQAGPRGIRLLHLAAPLAARAAPASSGVEPSQCCRATPRRQSHRLPARSPGDGAPRGGRPSASGGGAGGARKKPRPRPAFDRAPAAAGPRRTTAAYPAAGAV